MGKTPLERYQNDLEQGRIVPDPGQAEAVELLQRLFLELTTAPARPTQGLVRRLLKGRSPGWRLVRGLYLWGRVGRGKTYLVDTFFDTLPFAEKRRIHFHSFMRATHEALRNVRDQSDPLIVVAGRWATEQRVLCLDEFHVGDITDAMLLAGLLEALLERGVAILATSNDAPDELYAGGLQRQRFLPAIELIKRHLGVFELAGANDYRLRTLQRAPVYYVAEAGGAERELSERFDALTRGTGATGGVLSVEGREVPVQRVADGVVWFSFDVLCGGTRSTGDYIEIARCHHTVILSDVPRLGHDDADAARRFINLVDELYDRNVNLVLSAQAEPEQLYQGARLQKPFLRTVSRLHEMRSREYLARSHLSV